MPVLLVVLVVLMPVSYRAGTDVSHPHTIFQSLIDTPTGKPHHHAHDHSHEDKDEEQAGSEGLPVAPGSSDHQRAEHLEPHLTSPDMPSWLTLSNPIVASAAIQALAALVAVILSSSVARSMREVVCVISGLTLPLKPPPPRRSPGR